MWHSKALDEKQQSGIPSSPAPFLSLANHILHLLLVHSPSPHASRDGFLEEDEEEEDEDEEDEDDDDDDDAAPTSWCDTKVA